MNPVTSRLAARLAERTGTLPSVQVHSSAELQEGVHLVVLSHSSDAGPKANMQALASVFKGRATPVPGSFRRINPKQESRLVSVGYVIANTAVEELTADRESGMKVMAKNVLMDSHDQSLWNVVTSDGGSKFIRRQDNEDVSELLATMASARFDVTDVEDINACVTATADYVAFVDVESAELGYGFVVASTEDESQILPRGGTELVTIANDLIVANVPNIDSGDFLAKRLSRVEAKLQDADKMKEYFRQLYSFDPSYLELVEKTIDQQASL